MLKRLFALSDQGSKDLNKGIAATDSQQYLPDYPVQPFNHGNLGTAECDIG